MTTGQTTWRALGPRRGVFATAGVALAAVALGACGGDSTAKGHSAGDTRPRAREAVTVDIDDFKFKPPAVRVRAGGTISFVNTDKAPHTAQTDLNPKAAEFDTGRLGNGERKVVKLRTPGRFSYFCAYHRFMEGDVRVEE